MDAAIAAETQAEIQFAKQPLMAASVYLALADAFEGRSAYKRAREALAKASSAFIQAEGAGSADFVITSLRCAYLEALAKNAGTDKKASDLLAAAIPRIGKLGHRTPEAIVWLLITRYQLDYDNDDAEVPLREVTAAVKLADTMPLAFDEQFWIKARLAEANSLDVSGKLDDADALLKYMQTKLSTSPGSTYPDMLEVRLEQARVLLARHKYKETAAAVDKLYPAIEAVFGATNSKSLMTREVRAQARLMMEDYDGGIQDEIAVHKSASESDGENSYYAQVTSIDIPMEECRKGDGEAGLIAARRIYNTVRSMLGENSTRAQFVLANVAFCQTIQKDYRGAQSTIGMIDVQRAAQVDFSPAEFVATIDLMKAQAALSTGNAVDVAALLRLPHSILSKPDADPYLKRWTERLWEALPAHRAVQIRSEGR